MKRSTRCRRIDAPARGGFRCIGWLAGLLGRRASILGRRASLLARWLHFRGTVLLRFNGTAPIVLDRYSLFGLRGPRDLR